MKSWEVSDEIRRDAAVAASVNFSRPLLEEVIGRSTDSVDARWALEATDTGRKILWLTLADWTDADGVSMAFEPGELATGDRARRKMKRLFGDLLQARSHRQLEHLQQMFEE